MKATAWAVWGAVAVTLAGCGARQDVVELDPLTFQARTTADGAVVVDALDADVLLDEASQAYAKGRFREAADKYDVFAATFPEHPHIGIAHFNAGLCRQKLGEWAKAQGHFEAFLALAVTEKDQVDGLFRLADTQRQLEDWEGLGRSGDRLLALRLSVVDRAEAQSLRGLAWQHAGELARAERAYEEALAIYQEHADLRPFQANYYVAMAQFQTGEIYRTLFDGIAFRLPTEQMERDLEDKSKLLLSAQSAYLKAIRMRNSEWALAAGFKIGAIYEAFHADMLTAEYPDDMDAEETAIYFEELRKKIRPLITRAVEVYERNLVMSQRTGMTDTEWARRTRDRLDQLKVLIDEEDAQLSSPDGEGSILLNLPDPS
jgi:tetratricopeptide (TPR) repeat protein